MTAGAAAAPLRIEIDACGCVWRTDESGSVLEPCTEHWLIDVIEEV